MTRIRDATAAALAAIAAVALATGCGGGGDIAPLNRFGDSPPSAKERATLYAHAVNLRPADLPYFEAKPAEHETKKDPLQLEFEREFRRCAGIKGGSHSGDDRSRVAKVDSPVYETHSSGALLSIQSGVEVLDDAAVASRRARFIRSSHARACFERSLAPALEAGGGAEVEFGPVSVSRLPARLPGGEDFGYRISTSVSAVGENRQLVVYRPTAEGGRPDFSIPFYMDLLAFVSGPAEVDLIASGAPAPVSKNLERNLLTLLHERAVAVSP
jgi:hypothetical protein